MAVIVKEAKAAVIMAKKKKNRKECDVMNVGYDRLVEVGKLP